MQSHSSEIDSGPKFDAYFRVGDLLNGQAQRNPFHFPLQKIKNSFNFYPTYVRDWTMAY